MQGQQDTAFPKAGGAKGIQRGTDFRATRHEDQNIALSSLLDDTLHGVRGLFRGRSAVAIVGPMNVHRIGPTFRDENGCRLRVVRTEVAGDGFGFQGGGHHHQFQIRPAGLLKPLGQREGDVAQQIAFMKFVKDQNPDLPQLRIVLHPTQQNAFGDKANSGLGCDVVFEANLVADLLSRFAAAFPSDAGGDTAGRHSPGLQHDNPAIPGHATVEQHLRDLGGFAGSGGRHQHELPALTQGAEDVRVQLPDRQIARIHGTEGRRGIQNLPDADDGSGLGTQREDGRGGQQGQQQQHARRHEFSGLDQAQDKHHQQRPEHHRGHHEGQNAGGRKRQRNGGADRGDQGGAAFGFQKANHAAHHQQRGKDPDNKIPSHGPGRVSGAVPGETSNRNWAGGNLAPGLASNAALGNGRQCFRWAWLLETFGNRLLLHV